MKRAIELAELGRGLTSPNPLVGALVVRDDEVLGEGYHAAYGSAHAEVAALSACTTDPIGATMYVTLEPCCHHGRTPPCTDAIVAAGVARVVAAIADPDPRAGGGARVLRARGVTVAIGLLAEAAAALNAPFLFAREQAERPFVALKLATSVDGRIADAAGSSQWVSGTAAREYVHWLRAGFDAIAVGGLTALRDNPQLTVRGPVTPRRPPIRVVFDRRAMLNPSTLLVSSARDVPTWVMASLESPDASVTALEQNGVRVFRPVSLADGLRMLREAGVETLLCEGGGALGARLLADGLVDRLYWVQSPVWLGEGAVPAFPGVAPQPLATAPRWTPVERSVLGSDTLLVLDRRLCLPAS
jgi:diaminohydroxyphosphoribosylaminopyrimidine deaminase/5-amino-6-(5-phosphoribosylamino)uracil reductase